MRTTPALALLVSPLFFVACGAGAPASVVRPSDPTAASALGEASCHDVAGKQGQPLVVDWAPEQRGDLEVAMKDGVAVLSYSCTAIKVLPDCHLDGKYGFMGTTRAEQVVQLANADELAVNLPLSGAKLGTELARGSTIDVAMVMIGKRRTTWDQPTTADLKGSCEGATHYLRSATVGAFAMDTGTQGKVRAAAEMFGIGASGGSESAKKVHAKQGDLADCEHASPDSDKAPPQCGAPIRLVLAPIAEAPAKAPGATAPPPAPAPGAAPAGAPRFSRPEEADACPPGLVWAGGKCAKAADVAVHTCKPGDVDDCTAQCGKNDAASCAILGAHYASSNQASKAQPPLAKACTAGEAHACTNLGVLTASASGGKGDPQLFKKGCDGGDAVGCRHLGLAYAAAKDDAKSFAAFRSSCEGGDAAGCGAVGAAYTNGAGTSKDPVKGVEYKRRGCDGGDARSCADVAAMLETGKGVPKNEILARMDYQRACFRDPRGAADACTGLGRVTWKENPQLAKTWFDRGCAFGDATACAVLKVMYGEARPSVANIQAGQDAQRACVMGDGRACTTAGLLQAGTGALPMAKPNVQRGCQLGDAFACELAKKL